MKEKTAEARPGAKGKDSLVEGISQQSHSLDDEKMRAKNPTIFHCSFTGLQKKELLTGLPRTICQDMLDLALAREGWRTLCFLVKVKGI